MSLLWGIYLASLVGPELEMGVKTREDDSHCRGVVCYGIY